MQWSIVEVQNQIKYEKAACTWAKCKFIYTTSYKHKKYGHQGYELEKLFNIKPYNNTSSKNAKEIVRKRFIFKAELLPMETKAIAHIKATPFYIFTDDAAWVSENFKLENAIYVQHNTSSDSWQDMYLMSQCKHNIIANSSFSWWGAWLNTNPEKIVIAPKI